MDLDELITKNKLGIVAGSALQMQNAVQHLMSNKVLEEYSERIQTIFTHKFSAPNRIEDFSHILLA